MEANCKISWNWNYIVLSYILSFAGSYIAVCLSEQYRQCLIHNALMIGRHMFLWLMAVAVGGVAIWSMHFIGMGAIILKTASNVIISVEFDLLITLTSFLVGILFVYGGLLVATSDRVFTRNQREFDEMILADASMLSIKDARNKSTLKLLALFKGLKPIILGGIVAAGGICVMHYIGMTAQIFYVQMEWNPGIVAASIIIAVVASIAAFWIMFRLLPIFPQAEIYKLASATIMGIAVCGMHYCGIYAATYKISSTSTKVVSMSVRSDVAVLSALTLGITLLVIIHIITYAELKNRNLKLLAITKRFSNVVVDLKNSHLTDALAPYMSKFEGVLNDLDTSSTSRRSSVMFLNRFTNSNAGRISLPKIPSKKILVRTATNIATLHHPHSGVTPEQEHVKNNIAQQDMRVYDFEDNVQD